jgi:hypothetical protein
LKKRTPTGFHRVGLGHVLPVEVVNKLDVGTAQEGKTVHERPEITP